MTRCQLLILCLICSQTLLAQVEFFDDFNYASPEDTLIENFGWNLLDEPNWPGQNGPVPYTKDNVNFIDNPIAPGDKMITLSTQTTNQLSDRSFSRIEYSEYLFLDGVYAARVLFDNASANSQDGNVETFYTIFNAPSGDLEHAECDFEYLPYNIWGGSDMTNTLYATTWESYILSPWLPTNASTGVQDDFSGDWKILLFTVLDDAVTYYVDGELFATHTVDDQDGTSSVYPDNLMQISFANWIWSNNSLPLGPSPDWRTSTMQVDWVYHQKGVSLTQAEVLDKVNDFRTASIFRKNSMNETSSVQQNTNTNLSFELFPNPGLGNTLTIVNQSTQADDAHIKILDSKGDLVLEKRMESQHTNQLKVDVSNLPKGLYFITCIVGHQAQTIKWVLH